MLPQSKQNKNHGPSDSRGEKKCSCEFQYHILNMSTFPTREGVLLFLYLFVFTATLDHLSVFWREQRQFICGCRWKLYMYDKNEGHRVFDENITKFTVFSKYRTLFTHFFKNIEFYFFQKYKDNCKSWGFEYTLSTFQLI